MIRITKKFLVLYILMIFFLLTPIRTNALKSITKLNDNIKNSITPINTTTNTTASDSSNPYFLQVIYVNKEKTSYEFGPRLTSNTTLRRWYYDNKPTIPTGYTLAGWQSSHYHGTNNFLTKEWWPIFGSTTALYTNEQYQQTVVLNSGEGVYLFYQATQSEAPKTYTYTMIYNANGGTVDKKESKTISIETTDISYEFNSIEPIRDGYKFTGWYTSDTGGDLISWPYTLTTTKNTATVYAHWQKVPDPTPTAKVIYLPGVDGSGSKEETIPSRQEYTILSPESAGIKGPEGKIFSYWEKEENKYSPSDKFTPLDYSTNTFVAVWKDENEVDNKDENLDSPKNEDNPITKDSIIIIMTISVLSISETIILLRKLKKQ